MTNTAVEILPDLEGAAGQEQGETAAMVGRGSLVFFGGMALAAASFLVERAVVRAIRKA